MHWDWVTIAALVIGLGAGFKAGSSHATTKVKRENLLWELLLEAGRNNKPITLDDAIRLIGISGSQFLDLVLEWEKCGKVLGSPAPIAYTKSFRPKQYMAIIPNNKR